MTPALSVVMPAYNEAANLEAAVGEVVNEVFAVVPDSELIVVDDGSRDHSADVVRALARDDPRIRLVRQGNAGHGPALLRGMREARGHWCLLIDSDRQIPLHDFARTWALAGKSGVCLGIRHPRQDPAHRRLLSRALAVALRALDRRAPRDANVPYKLIRRDRLDEVLALLPEGARVPSVMISLWLAVRGHPYAEQPVSHRPRQAGENHLRPWRLTRFCAAAIVELARFHRQLRRAG